MLDLLFTATNYGDFWPSGSLEHLERLLRTKGGSQREQELQSINALNVPSEVYWWLDRISPL